MRVPSRMPRLPRRWTLWEIECPFIQPSHEGFTLVSSQEYSKVFQEALVLLIVLLIKKKKTNDKREYNDLLKHPHNSVKNVLNLQQSSTSNDMKRRQVDNYHKIN